MKWTGLNELREKYLSFFESKGHLRLDSFPLVPKNDPSLLLINSGMAPMKKWFLAQEEPPCHRVTTCQKCIRTPDIERVGITARHGTFFEMLGNFSFQDYFKEEAIPWAWEFLTSPEWMDIPKERLYISVYLDDDEAYDIWTKKVGIPEDHMVRFGKEDNFWEHGSGPCGPCSEIYYDRGPEYGCGKPDCKVGCDCDRYMEIWNNVFSQFDSDGKGHYERLARPNIDTGMGLERLACVMQNVGNLFEVDTVQSVLHHVEHISGKTYKQDEKTDISIRVITDHIRSCTFMVSDGILPSNEGRGYVLRRLLRRAARHGRMLGIQHPFLVALVETVILSSESAYPELREHDAYIKKVIGTEEANFYRTIDAGMNILSTMIEELKSKQETVLQGADVFKLNDTFGFPLDLTKEIAAEAGIAVDEEGFHTQMRQQKERARAERLKKNISGWSADLFSDLSVAPTVFTGYDTLTDEGTVQALSDEETLTDAISTDDQAKEGVLVVLDQTPFYAEMGGQVADHGVLTGPEASLKVLDVKKTPKGYFVHTCVLESGIVKVGDRLTAQVDRHYRMDIARNHTATHLLQAALREVLGDHVHQAGSYQDASVTRFDFTHFSAVTKEELQKVEQLVNEMILDASPVVTREMSIDEAKKLGAMALFGEKYGNTVRVVQAGEKSVELCGGTHVDNTSRVGLFKIVSESSVAAGIRRIEGVTGNGVMKLIHHTQSLLMGAAENLKLGNPEELVSKTASVMAEMKAKEKELESLSAKMANQSIDRLLESAEQVGSVKVVHGVIAGAKPDALRMMGDRVKELSGDMVGVLVGTADGKGNILAVCGKDAVKSGIHAGKLVKAVATLTGASGGGRPDSAMGGVGDVAKIDEAMSQVSRLVSEMLK